MHVFQIYIYVCNIQVPKLCTFLWFIALSVYLNKVSWQLHSRLSYLAKKIQNIWDLFWQPMFVLTKIIWSQNWRFYLFMFITVNQGQYVQFGYHARFRFSDIQTIKDTVCRCVVITYFKLHPSSLYTRQQKKCTTYVYFFGIYYSDAYIF